MAGDIPCPEFDYMAIGIGDVRGASSSVAEVLDVDVITGALQVLNEAVEVRLVDVQREVDVSAAALTREGLHAHQP